VVSGHSQAIPKEPTVRTINPTRPINTRFDKTAVSTAVGGKASGSEVKEDEIFKAFLL
jgi:hypothetical protein